MQELKTTRQKRYSWFIGTDISRNKLDHAVMKGSTFLFHRETGNDVISIKEFIKELKDLPGFSLAKSIFCMENTGVYCNHLIEVLQKLKANIVREPSVHIMKRLGVLRGKTDKLDAIRIVEYAHKYREVLRLLKPRRKVIDHLAQLNTLRTRLVAYHKALRLPIQEESYFIKKKTSAENKRLCARSILSLQLDIIEVDKQIDLVIQNDVELKRLFEIIVSVRNVGRVTAIHLLITTNEFKSITDPKKFACYAGIAPFAIESGLKKPKRRVSQMANKKMKSLLHLCALQSMRFCPDLRPYYLKKTLEEGKAPMAVLNAIRYKIILRIFACINQNRLYVKSYCRGNDIIFINE